MGDPGPFTCSFFTPLSTADFLGKPFAWWEVKSWRILHLCWRLFSGLGCFLSFLPNWALCGPNRPLTGLGRVVPPPGVELGYTGPPGGNQGACRFCGTAECGWFSQCRKERKIPLEGGRDWCHLPGLSKGCKEAMRTSVLFCLHTICRRFDFSKHKIGKCAPHPFALLHSSFFSQPIPLVGQANGLHIAS